MAYDHWKEIMALMVTKVEALDLALGTDPIPVVQRKLPSKQDTIDPQTQIIVSPSDQEPKIERYAFSTPSDPQGVARVTYYTDVVIVTPNTGDYQANLTTYTLWLQTIDELFSAPSGLAGITGLQDCRCSPLKFLSRGKIKVGYDYLGIKVSARVFKNLTG